MAYNGILRESPVKFMEWSIPNFFDLPTDSVYVLRSPVFSLSGGKWFIAVFPNATCGANVYLKREPIVKEHRITFTIGIKNNDGSDVEVQTEEQTFLNGADCGHESLNYNLRFRELRLEDVVSPDGTLTIFYFLRIMNQRFSPSTLESSTQTLSEDTPLIEDLKNLYFSSCHADVRITVKNKEFHAHRNILSSRSSVFGSMFLHDMEEKNSGNVEIPDCDPDTFEDFLIFLYTGKFDIVSCSNAVSLYRTADKYNVKELKEKCVRCMVDKLSDDIFCDVLHLATMQNEKNLLKAVTDYFINNAQTIIITAKWQTLLAEHPILGNELFFKLLNSKNNNK